MKDIVWVILKTVKSTGEFVSMKVYKEYDDASDQRDDDVVSARDLDRLIELKDKRVR
jgi:hypothetical protein